MSYLTRSDGDRSVGEERLSLSVEVGHGISHNQILDSSLEGCIIHNGNIGVGV